MNYVLILILKYHMENVAVSQYPYSSEANCEYAKAKTESLATNYMSINAICVKE